MLMHSEDFTQVRHALHVRHHPLLYTMNDRRVISTHVHVMQIEVGSDMLSELERKFLTEGLGLRVQCYEVR
jgi:hypothetical protein